MISLHNVVAGQMVLFLNDLVVNVGVVFQEKDSPVLQKILNDQIEIDFNQKNL